jgi:predicted PurR-regulated permease PerM
VITITVLPIPSRLTKRGLPGWLSMVLSILVVVLLLALVIATIFFSVAKLSTELPMYVEEGTTQATEDLSSTGDTTLSIEIEQTTKSIGPLVQSFLESILNILVTFGLALVIFFFMISAALALPTPSRMGLDPGSSIIKRVAQLTEDVRKYMTVLTGVNFLVGLGDTIFLLILGVDYGLHPFDWFHDRFDPAGAHGLRGVRSTDCSDCGGRICLDQWRYPKFCPTENHGG